jgi:hypothetical protein
MLDERARNRMHNRLREVMGDDVADTMMDSLPMGRHELATKQDLQLLEQSLIAAFRGELTGALTTTITSQSRSITFQVVGLFVAFASLTWMVR